MIYLQYSWVLETNRHFNKHWFIIPISIGDIGDISL